MRARFIAICLFVSSSPAAAVESIPFERVWELVRGHSPSLKQSQSEWKAADAAHSLAAAHWFPRLFVDAQAISTNDPLRYFGFLLQQRAVQASDFVPDTLNNAPRTFNQRVSVGLDFALYEGGGKVAASRSAREALAAADLSRIDATAREYSTAAVSYGSLLIDQDQIAALERLESTIEGILSRYQLGARQNPVGHSGLLGLKSLASRVVGMKAQTEARIASFRADLAIRAPGLPAAWKAEREPILAFVGRRLSVTSPQEESPTVKAARARAFAARESIGAERARVLPVIGLFGSYDLVSGERETGSSVSFGGYLRWDIFSPANLGVSRQATEAANAAEAAAEVAALRDRNERAAMQEEISGLTKVLKSMSVSSALLEEQTDAARKLFQAGSINLLQLVEVLARRADLIESLAQARTRYLSANGRLYTLSAGQEDGRKAIP